MPQQHHTIEDFGHNLSIHLHPNLSTSSRSCTLVVCRRSGWSQNRHSAPRTPGPVFCFAHSQVKNKNTCLALAIVA
jgi:hypothetical protein